MPERLLNKREAAQSVSGRRAEARKQVRWEATVANATKRAQVTHEWR